MSSNFSPFPDCDVVQGALALEPRESTFHRLSLFQERLTPRLNEGLHTF